MSDSVRPHGLQPTRLLHPWDFPGKSTGVGCHCLLCEILYTSKIVFIFNFHNLFSDLFVFPLGLIHIYLLSLFVYILNSPWKIRSMSVFYLVTEFITYSAPVFDVTVNNLNRKLLFYIIQTLKSN